MIWNDYYDRLIRYNLNFLNLRIYKRSKNLSFPRAPACPKTLS